MEGFFQIQIFDQELEILKIRTTKKLCITFNELQVNFPKGKLNFLFSPLLRFEAVAIITLRITQTMVG